MITSRWARVTAHSLAMSRQPCCDASLPVLIFFIPRALPALMATNEETSTSFSAKFMRSACDRSTPLLESATSGRPRETNTSTRHRHWQPQRRQIQFNCSIFSCEGKRSCTIMKLLVVALTLAAQPASAFHVSSSPRHDLPSSTSWTCRPSTPPRPHELSTDLRPDDILGALSTLEGPVSAGATLRGWKTRRRRTLRSTITSTGSSTLLTKAECTKILRGNGTFTIFALTNSAMQK